MIDHEPVVETNLSKSREDTIAGSESASYPVHSCEITSAVINGIVEPLKNMMENLVKPIVKSLEVLRGSSQSSQGDALMDTNTTLEEVRTPVAKNPTIQAIDEYMDRERRKCNLIIHNVPEDNPSRDHEKVGSLLESEFEVPKSCICNVSRLGRPSSNKARLLLVKLDKEQHKHTVMKKATKLRANQKWKNVFITPDLTTREREVNKALRDELKRRKGNGEQNLMIKRGRIVSKSDPSQCSSQN